MRRYKRKGHQREPTQGGRFLLVRLLLLRWWRIEFHVLARRNVLLIPLRDVTAFLVNRGPVDIQAAVNGPEACACLVKQVRCRYQFGSCFNSVTQGSVFSGKLSRSDRAT